MFDVILERFHRGRRELEDGYALKQTTYRKYAEIVGAIDAENITRDFLFCLDPITKALLVRTSDMRVVTASLEAKPCVLSETGAKFDFCLVATTVARNGDHRLPIDPERWFDSHVIRRLNVEVEKLFVRTEWRFCNRQGTKFFIPAATFVGRIVTRDATAINARIENGIGRHRAFGFGMMQLWKV